VTVDSQRGESKQQGHASLAMSWNLELEIVRLVIPPSPMANPNTVDEAVLRHHTPPFNSNALSFFSSVLLHFLLPLL
jgi:hypothetical protein